eukprot:486521_1
MNLMNINDKYKLNSWQGKRYTQIILNYIGYDWIWYDPAEAFDMHFSESLLIKKYFGFNINTINLNHSDIIASSNTKVSVFTQLPRNKITNNNQDTHDFDTKDLKWYGDTALEYHNILPQNAIFINNTYPKLLFIRNHVNNLGGQYGDIIPQPHQQIQNRYNDFIFGNNTYTLQTKVIYTGAHYFTYVKWIIDDKWYKINDEKIEQVTEREAHITIPGEWGPCDTVILLYRKK